MRKTCLIATFGCLLAFGSCSQNDPEGLNITREAAADSLARFFLRPLSQNLVFRNVNVVNAESGSIAEKMDVFVKDKKVTSVLPTGEQSTAGFTIIDATGKFISPGFADMHAHVYPGKDLSNDLFLFLAKGITTVRIMWGSRYHVALRDSINRGLKIGPRLLVASGGFDGTSQFWPGSIVTNSVAEVRSSVDALKAIGYDYIKVYSSLPRDQYLELVNYAWERGIPPVGHVPFEIDAFEAVNSKQSSIEHFAQVAASGYGTQAVFESSLTKDVYFCPTLTVLNRVVGSIPSYQTPWLDLVSKDGREFFDRTRGLILPTNKFFEQNLELLKKLYGVRGNIISGTDNGIRYVLPGPSLHEELRYYAQAGMSSMDVLKTTTVNVSRYLGEEIAAVEAGRPANLVLLSANPFSDVSNTEKIDGIVISGRWMSATQIDHTLQLIKAYNSKL